MREFLSVVQKVLFLMEKGIVEGALGGFDGLLAALLLFMVVEYLSQVLLAVMNRKMSKEAGICGVAKKAAVLSLVAVGNVTDIFIIQSGNLIRTMVIFFYLSHEGRVIVENAEKMGLPIPQKLKDILEQIKG